MNFNCRKLLAGFAACSILSLFNTTALADDPIAAMKTREGELIRVLTSDSPPADKAITCKYLAVFGSATAVPALAPLLEDPHLASWARTALEVIPGPEADKALRDAMDKVNGNLLVGVINSIAVRKDEKAVPTLVARMSESDNQVAGAAAVALGKIGGTPATKALTTALEKASPAAAAEIAHGCNFAAEGWLNSGKYSQAEMVYDLVRKADVPQQRKLEAIRGAVLARRSEGIPLLLEQLRSDDKDLLAIGLRTARELPGQEATKALAAELNRIAPERQPLLLLALADRADATALPAIVDAAKTGSTPVRLAAVEVLEHLGNVSTVPVLLDMASSSETALAGAAKNSLARLPGSDVDGQLLEQLDRSSGKTRQVLIELAAKRQIPAALPTVTRSMNDQDAGVRSAAIQAVGLMGSEKEAAILVNNLKSAKNGQNESDIEAALLAICGRDGKNTVPHLLPLARQGDADQRIVALHALAAAGGGEALSAIQSATQDSETTVQDEAVRTLSSWPDTWPDDRAAAEPLLALAKSAQKTSHQILALRGYLQLVQASKDLKDADKVSQIDSVLPLMRRPEEKRLAIPVLQSIVSGPSLELLGKLAADEAVAEEACGAILRIVTARNASSIPKEQRKNALMLVKEKGTDNAKGRAERLLRDIT